MYRPSGETENGISLIPGFLAASPCCLCHRRFDGRENPRNWLPIVEDDRFSVGPPDRRSTVLWPKVMRFWCGARGPPPRCRQRRCFQGQRPTCLRRAKGQDCHNRRFRAAPAHPACRMRRTRPVRAAASRAVLVEQFSLAEAVRTLRQMSVLTATWSATGLASPSKARLRRLKRCAISVFSRTNKRYPGA